VSGGFGMLRSVVRTICGFPFLELSMLKNCVVLTVSGTRDSFVFTEVIVRHRERE